MRLNGLACLDHLPQIPTVHTARSILAQSMLDILQILSSWELVMVQHQRVPSAAMLWSPSVILVCSVSTTLWVIGVGEWALATTRSTISSTMSSRSILRCPIVYLTMSALTASTGNITRATDLTRPQPHQLLPRSQLAQGRPHARRQAGGDVSTTRLLHLRPRLRQ